MRTFFRCASLVAVAAGLIAASPACTTDYQRGLEDPLFGDPNSLAGQKQPGPTSANTATEAGPASGNTPECVRAGGALIGAAEGGACAVKFSTDVLPAFGTAGCQVASCHGGATPANQPRIDPADPQGMWAEFAAFKLSNGKPYINPCSIDPAQASIACNVNKAAPCGSIMPPGLGIDPAAVAKIETWLKCGSPNN